MPEDEIQNTHCVLKFDIKEGSLAKFRQYDELNEEIEVVINNFFKTKEIESELLSSYCFYPDSVYMPNAVKCEECNQWLLKNTGSSEGCVYEYAIEPSVGVYYCDHCHSDLEKPIKSQ